MNQEEILNFIATLDHRLLAAAAVLLLLLLLFWRVLRRTSRVEREVARLNERLERIREEVNAISRSGSLTVAPAKETSTSVEEVAQAPLEAAGLAVDQPEEDVLSRAVASLAAANSGEDLEASESDDSFSFEQSPTAESNAFEVAVDEVPALPGGDNFSFGEPEEEPAAAEEPVAPTPDESEPVAAVEEAPSGVVRLEGDPARPGVSMVRCLSCNYKLAYPEKLAGKRVRCPSCRTGLDLP